MCQNKTALWALHLRAHKRTRLHSIGELIAMYTRMKKRLPAQYTMPTAAFCEASRTVLGKMVKASGIVF
jgi:hypothetical protein